VRQLAVASRLVIKVMNVLVLPMPMPKWYGLQGLIIIIIIGTTYAGCSGSQCEACSAERC
jgi:hypothetical protein